MDAMALGNAPSDVLILQRACSLLVACRVCPCCLPLGVVPPPAHVARTFRYSLLRCLCNVSISSRHKHDLGTCQLFPPVSKQWPRRVDELRWSHWRAKLRRRLAQASAGDGLARPTRLDAAEPGRLAIAKYGSVGAGCARGVGFRPSPRRVRPPPAVFRTTSSFFAWYRSLSLHVYLSVFGFLPWFCVSFIPGFRHSWLPSFLYALLRFLMFPIITFFRSSVLPCFLASFLQCFRSSVLSCFSACLRCLRSFRCLLSFGITPALRLLPSLLPFGHRFGDGQWATLARSRVFCM